MAGGKAHLGLIPRAIESDVAGVGVGSVVRSSPAQRAGIKAGDIVTMFDGQPISSTTELKRVMNQRRPGDTVVLKLLRAGENLELKVTLGGK